MLTKAMRVLSVADVCDALRASRPYRPGLETDHVLEVMRREAGAGLDADCVAALEAVLGDEAIADAPETPAARVIPALAEDYHQAA